MMNTFFVQIINPVFAATGSADFDIPGIGASVAR